MILSEKFKSGLGRLLCGLILDVSGVFLMFSNWMEENMPEYGFLMRGLGAVVFLVGIYITFTGLEELS